MLKKVVGVILVRRAQERWCYRVIMDVVVGTVGRGDRLCRRKVKVGRIACEEDSTLSFCGPRPTGIAG